MGAAPGSAQGGHAAVAPGLGSVTLNVDLTRKLCTGYMHLPAFWRMVSFCFLNLAP